MNLQGVRNSEGDLVTRLEIHAQSEDEAVVLAALAAALIRFGPNPMKDWLLSLAASDSKE